MDIFNLIFLFLIYPVHPLTKNIFIGSFRLSNQKTTFHLKFFLKMDVIFQSCLQEISLFGFQGCSFSQMYKIVSEKFSMYSFDDFMKKKIFSLLLDEDDITIYEPYDH